MKRSPLAIVAFLLAAASLVLPTGADAPGFFFFATPALLFAASALALFASASNSSLIALLILVHLAAIFLIGLLGSFAMAAPAMGYWFMVVAAWLLAVFS